MKNYKTAELDHGDPAISTIQPLPYRLRIHLESEDAAAWDRAALGTGLRGREYAADIMRRMAAKPLDAQPEIYEMPQCPGREWPGDLRGVSIDEPVALAAVRIAGELGVTVEDWAYSALIAETLSFREKPVTDLRQGEIGGRFVPLEADGRRNVIIQVNAALYDEVRELLKSPEAVALFGPTTIGRRLAACAGGWMRDMSFALTGGSGLTRAMDLAGKGGNR